MLTVTISAEETWDEIKEEFVPAMPPVTLTLEHSLISLSKWESKWHKPYLSSQLTLEETKDYIRCMTLTQNVPQEVFDRIGPDVIKQVADYISDPMTATWFTDDKTPGNGMKKGKMKGEIVTSEVIYYWMISGQVPMECQKWHLNRLLTLIRVIGEKNKPAQKMSKGDLTRKYAQLNAQRKAAMHTRG